MKWCWVNLLIPFFPQKRIKQCCFCVLGSNEILKTCLGRSKLTEKEATKEKGHEEWTNGGDHPKGASQHETWDA